MDNQGEPKILIKQKTHSRLGIASFILSLLAPLLCIGSLAAGAIMLGYATPKLKVLQELIFVRIVFRINFD